MQAVVYNPTIEQGASASFDITIAVNNIPKNLTGYIGRSQIRDRANGTILATPVVSIVDATAGLMNWYLSDEESSKIPTTGEVYNKKEKYVYDVIIESPGGKITRVINGVVYVSPGVTRNG